MVSNLVLSARRCASSAAQYSSTGHIHRPDYRSCFTHMRLQGAVTYRQNINSYCGGHVGSRASSALAAGGCLPGLPPAWTSAPPRAAERGLLRGSESQLRGPCSHLDSQSCRTSAHHDAPYSLVRWRGAEKGAPSYPDEAESTRPNGVHALGGRAAACLPGLIGVITAQLLGVPELPTGDRWSGAPDHPARGFSSSEGLILRW